MYKNILIPTDGSELAGKAVQHGISLAKELGAKITALTVWEPFRVSHSTRAPLKTHPKTIKEHTEACCEDP
jgi:nucleotide-binding universal stress UspA family protein